MGQIEELELKLDQFKAAMTIVCEAVYDIHSIAELNPLDKTSLGIRSIARLALEEASEALGPL